MSNWLEKAESSAAEMEEKRSQDEKLHPKKEAIQKNYQDNRIQYENFIAELDKLVHRVNDLPIEYREPFGKISHHTKESRLDNHLNYLTSSKRIKKRLYRNLFHFLKIYNFKRIRVTYITVSSVPGKMDVEIKENMLLRVRMTRTGENERVKYPGKRKYRKDYRFRLDMNNTGVKEAMGIIDWLAFKIEMEKISFFKEENQVDSS